MAPKRKAETDAPNTTLSEEQYNIQQAEQRAYLISAGIITEDSVDSGVETTPPVKKAKKDLQSTSAAPASAIAAETATQGTPARPAKKTSCRKRKTAVDDKSAALDTPLVNSVQDTPATAAPQRQKKAASTARKPRKKKNTAATAVHDASPGAGANECAVAASLPPLSSTLKAKLHNVLAFLTVTAGPSIARISNDSNRAIVREFDVIAALMILRADYCLGNPYDSVSLNEAEDMIVVRHENGWCTVDFGRTVPIEREVQAKIAGRWLQLEDVTLLEVEVEMMQSRRAWLKNGGFGNAGFRMWDEYGRPTETDVPEMAEPVAPEENGRRGVCPAPMLEV